ncbi:MAG: DsrE/DsrF/DrsH-like family protein [Dehalococcoidales bacterium]|nr:DsrE/DsrF/DrsH-like family protein [Dehalococcoidales bacterium]
MAENEKMTLVVFSGDLDKAMAAFILATTGASMGMEVQMFFTFWGLNIIKKNEGSIKSKGLMRKMLNWMNRGGSSRLKLSKFNMMGLGTGMMKTLMKETKTPSIDEFITMAHEMGVKLIACTTSCGVMGLGEDAFRSEVDMMAGAAYFLGEASKSKISLFI